MGMVRFQLPLPLPGPGADSVLRDWADRLVARLTPQEFKEETVEEALAFGGLEIADRFFPIEGVFSGYTAPEDTEILAAPAAGKKRLVTAFYATGPVGGNANGYLYKKKGASEIYLAGPQSIIHNVMMQSLKWCRIMLDDTDESIRLRITAGTSDVFWNGCYVELD